MNRGSVAGPTGWGKLRYRMHSAFLLAIFVVGCGASASPDVSLRKVPSRPPERTTSSDDVAPVDLSTKAPLNWQPYDNRGWRIYLPPDWSLRHETGFLEGIQSSPNGEVGAMLQKRLGDTKDAFAARSPGATRCLVHEESCWTMIFHQTISGERQSVLLVMVDSDSVDGAGVVIATCISPGEYISADCHTIGGTLQRTPTLGSSP